MNQYIKISITESGNWYEGTTEFLVPKVIGLINNIVKSILRYRKLLPLGNRLRNPQEEI